MKIRKQVNQKSAYMDTSTIPFYKSKVFWSGIAGAVALVVQQFIGQTAIDWPAMGLAALVAIGGYLATTLRGQNMSTWLGAIGNVILAGLEIYKTGDFTWEQFGLHAALAILAYAAPDPKTVGYERTDVIKNAKIQGQIITPSVLSDNNIKEAATAAKVQASGNVAQAVDIAKSKTT